MLDFTFCNPTKVIFGKGQISKLAEHLPAGARILLAYGGGSIKKNGTYDQVIEALQGFSVTEFSGIEPNPTYETLMRAVGVIKEKELDFILAVGGGSVIDGVKFIAAAAKFEGSDPWDIVAKWAPFKEALPYGAILTLPATGSEMNMGSVVTKAATQEKLAFLNPLVYPQFSILDPETTYSLPPKQVANGVIDAFVHIAEQYLTYPVSASVQDRFAEGLMLTLIEEGPKALKDPKNYDVRANVMWAATMALNGLIGSGVPNDWATHMIGHELTAKYGIDHAQTLAIVLPSLLRECRESKRDKLIQYGERVWGLTGDESQIVEGAISKTQDFFESLGISTHLKDYGVKEEELEDVIERLKSHGMVKLGERQEVTPEMSLRILEGAL
jgi:NADP-dependent alcohol dehydrogenase